MWRCAAIFAASSDISDLSSPLLSTKYRKTPVCNLCNSAGRDVLHQAQYYILS